MKEQKKYYIIIIALICNLEVVLSFYEKLTSKFKGKKCCVLGFGRSNKPLVDMLLDAGVEVSVHDGNANIKDEALAARGVRFFVGEDHLKELGGDYIFRSPGIRHYLPELQTAVQNGAILTSEMELFLSLCPAKVIGVTGSDGKTTSTTLTHLFLQKELEKSGGGKAYVGGNIGKPLLPLTNDMTKDDFAVVELSSFQLQDMKHSPSRALITNISPNHLDWHKDYEEYIEAKCNIFRNGGVEFLVTNAENDVTRAIADEADLPIVYFSSKAHGYDEIVPSGKKDCIAIYESEGIIYSDDGKTRTAKLQVLDILLPGRHNVENYMAAIGLTLGLVSSETVSEIARTFGGVEHRLEYVRTLDGVRYYNSSIDSSPSRTEAAVGALDKKPIIICGGAEKGIPFEPLAKTLCSGVKAVVLTGATAGKIMKAIEHCPDYERDKLRVKLVPDFKDAVMAAKELACDGDIVLLSPACTSFDRFKDFEERGNYFKEIVNEF